MDLSSGDVLDSLPLAAEQLLDEICLRFEAVWRSGRRPDLGSFLGDTAGLVRRALLRELIRLDVCYRVRSGEEPCSNEYLSRFPEMEAGWATEAIHAPTDAPGAQVDRSEDGRLVRQPPDARPAAVGAYDQLELLGHGGMGVVYRARHVKLNRIVALKMIRSGELASTKEVERFRTEAEAAALLDHPNIVPIYDVDEHHGLPYFSMKLIDGPSLAEALANGQWPRDRPECFRQAVQHVATVARAVHHAHQRGVLHRDLKPGNILFLHQAGSLVPMVADFGLAKRMAAGGDLTHTGTIVGTPAYMAPEQALASKSVSTAADVYSLGAILYEVLTGRPPFRGESTLEVLRQVIEQEPVRPSALQPGLPRDLETICLRCLHKEPEKRYPSAEALAEDLSCWLTGEPISARPVGRLERSWRWCRRNPFVAGLLATVVILLVLGTAISTSLALLAMHRAEQAEQAQREAEEKRLLAHHATARASLASALPGQQFESLAALAQAAELVRHLNKPPSELEELRRLAISALALPDVRLEKHWDNGANASSYHPFDELLQRYAWSDEKGNVSVYRFADDVVIARLAGHGRQATVAFGRGDCASSVVVYAPADRTLTLWDLPSGVTTELARLPVDDLVDLLTTWDGQQLVTLHRDRGVNVFELPSGRHRPTVRFGKWTTPGLATITRCECAMHPFRHQLAITMRPESDSQQGVVRIIDLDQGTVVTELQRATEGAASTVSWCPDGRSLAVGYERSVALWDVPTQQVLQPSLDHAGGDLCSAVNHTGDLLVSWSSRSGNQKMWHPLTFRPVMRAPSPWVFCREPTRDGRLWGWAWSGEGAPRDLWVIHPAHACRTFVRGPRGAPVGEYRMNAIHPEGRLAAVGTSTGVTLLDLATGVDVGHLDLGHNWGVAFDPSSGDLVTFGEKGLFRWPIHKVPGPTEQWRLGPHVPLPIEGAPGDHAVRISSDGKTLAVALGERAIVLHTGSTDRSVVLAPLEDVRQDIALSPDGQWVATGRDDGNGGDIRIWRASDGQLVKSFGIAQGMRVGFSPNGDWLVGNDRSRYYFWRVGSWEEGPQCRVPYAFGELAFSPNSRLMALERGDGAVRLVETATGRELAVLEDPQQGRSSQATFSPDGTRLLLTNKDHTLLRLWDLRKLRAGLEPLRLDWDEPPYPPEGRDNQLTAVRRPLEVQIVGGRASAE
jgi:serine/threonine protein kinase/WD40 repeat protein